MIPRWILAATCALACTAHAKEQPKPMSDGWFQRLQNPKTRIAALYEFENARHEKNEAPEDPEKFAAEHSTTLVFPCPQPQFPGAWAVIDATGWLSGQNILCGLEPQTYPPHPLEVERRRTWDAALEKPAPDFKPWQVGQPWFESMSGFLVDATGKPLGEGFFASPGIIADFDADGMLDLFEIQRLHLGKSIGSDPVIDCISIGPLASDQPRHVMLYCNSRKDISESPRTWRFDVRSDASHALQLVLIPTTKDQQEITFYLREGALVASVEKLPEGILVDPHPGNDSSSRDFLKKHGFTLNGAGSDDAAELDARNPEQPPRLSFKSLEWSFPATDALAPRDAAQAMASHQFGTFFKSQYDLTSIGDPVPAATRGWLERWSDGGCFGGESVVVWWFNGDSAEQWTQKDSSTFLVSSLSAGELGRRITITHEIDQIRTVPKTPFAPDDDHRQMGVSGPSYCRIRAMTSSPAPLATVFETSLPSGWQWVGPKYDRTLASAIATLFVVPTQAEAKTLSIRELAPIWLAPENVAKFPPGLTRAAVRAIGSNQWLEMKPLLSKLQKSLGAATDEEKRLAKVQQLLKSAFDQKAKANGRDEWLVERKTRDLKREQQELTRKMTGNPRFELLVAVKQSLSELEKPDKSRAAGH